jgi:hypothetical protein
MYVDLVHLQEERKLKISLEIASIGGALCTSDLMKKNADSIKFENNSSKLIHC